MFFYCSTDGFMPWQRIFQRNMIGSRRAIIAWTFGILKIFLGYVLCLPGRLQGRRAGTTVLNARTLALHHALSYVMHHNMSRLSIRLYGSWGHQVPSIMKCHTGHMSCIIMCQVSWCIMLYCMSPRQVFCILVCHASACIMHRHFYRIMCLCHVSYVIHHHLSSFIILHAVSSGIQQPPW